MLLERFSERSCLSEKKVELFGAVGVEVVLELFILEESRSMDTDEDNEDEDSLVVMVGGMVSLFVFWVPEAESKEPLVVSLEEVFACLLREKNDENVVGEEGDI